MLISTVGTQPIMRDPKALYEAILALTSGSPAEDLIDQASLFSQELDWRPTDFVRSTTGPEVASGHLVVEHGLQNAAVVTFLRTPFRQVEATGQRRLLSVSYNNLIDWSVFVSQTDVSYVYNRTSPAHIARNQAIAGESVEILRRSSFERIAADRPAPTLLALDEALVKTISDWRRTLATLVAAEIPLEALSALFNALLLVRASEDHLRATKSLADGAPANLTEFRAVARFAPGSPSALGSALAEHFEALGLAPAPDYLIDRHRLALFDQVDGAAARSLIADFYANRYAPYEYDFSLISKHALSKIYEHYVSALRVVESPQASMFPEFPQEDLDRAYGSVYTPLFLARFFARMIERLRPRSLFGDLRVIDPACGSGIFLRTLLELQLDPTIESFHDGGVAAAFERVLGVDRDPNACAASRLSLSLLHLVLTDTLPARIHVETGDALDLLDGHVGAAGAAGAQGVAPESFDVVLANPPFVSVESQSEEVRSKISEYLGPHAFGRVDLYLAFILLSLRLLKPGGLGLFVLPQSFLVSTAAERIRRELLSSTWIRVVADLSAIPVFQGIGTYVTVIVFERKSGLPELPPTAQVLKCRAQVGQALQDLVDERRADNSDYEIFELKQEDFQDSEWLLAPPSSQALKAKLRSFPRLASFLDVRQGVVTGCDEVFIRDASAVPRGEKKVWPPLLRDREVGQFRVAVRAESCCFFPWLGQEKLEEKEIRRRFPETWNYLVKNKAKLRARKSLERYGKSWWEPMWPRDPRVFFAPKIVTPHLVLLPRFSLDLGGKYLVSHAPVLGGRAANVDVRVLKYFVAVLNSSLVSWVLASQSRKYKSGYVAIEAGPLKNLPVPDPTSVSPVAMRGILATVDELLKEGGERASRLTVELDFMIAELYCLTEEDRAAIGLLGRR